MMHHAGLYSRQVLAYLRRNCIGRMRVRTALVDMDGTLYDSMPLHAKAWVEVARSMGFDEPAEEFFRVEGMTGKAVINMLVNRHLGRDASESEVRHFYEMKCELFRSYGAPQPMPGAGRMLAFFKEAGIKCVLVTGSGQRSLIESIERDYPGVFCESRMITSASVNQGKPHPEPYLRGLEIAGAQPSEAIVIENAPLGVESGRAAGVFTVGVNTGPIGVKELEEAGADAVFDSMARCADSMPALVYDMLMTRAEL